MAAIKAADEGLRVCMVESMPRPARKLGISGKGRGNLTNTAPLRDFLKHFNLQGRFLKASFAAFFNTDLVAFFAGEGLKTAEERGGRVFVASNRATDAVKCLHEAIEKRKVKLLTSSPAKRLLIENQRCTGVFLENGKTIVATKILLATGGLSYPLTGSTGAGIEMARACGHKIVTPLPSLVALKPETPLPANLDSVILKNVAAELRINGKKAAAEFGEMAFLDGYLAGPIIISLSRAAVQALQERQQVEITLDLKPALDHATLDRRILREIDATPGINVTGIIAKLLPADMRAYCLKQTELPGQLKACQMNANQRKALRNWLKEQHYKVIGHAPWEQAIVTAGGVATADINPNTLESKVIANLHFAGEIIDIDADTGGYNLQAAFSTGWLAGLSAAQAIKSASKAR
jgi:hypothetical protein